jgi:hypothetical protein
MGKSDTGTIFVADLHHLRKGAIMQETGSLVNAKLVNKLTFYKLYCVVLKSV